MVEPWVLTPGGYDAARAIVRDERYGPRGGPALARRETGRSVHGAQHLGNDDPHLESGEAGPRHAGCRRRKETSRKPGRLADETDPDGTRAGSW